MIKRYILLCAIVLGSPCVADAEPAPKKSTVSLRTTDGIEIGAQISYYKYQEPGYMNLKGPKIGLTVNAAKNLGYAWYVAGDARFAFGTVDYDGSGTQNNNADLLWDLRARLGRDVAVSSFVLSPYTGLGYRTLYDDLRGTSSTGANGYRRVSEYWYLPLGVIHRFQTGSDSRVATGLEYDYFISGCQTSYLSDADPGLNDPVNRQYKGHGFQASVVYEIRTWSAGVFYYYWSIEDSRSVDIYHYGVPIGFGLEPKNTTHEDGLQVKYRF